MVMWDIKCNISANTKGKTQKMKKRNEKGSKGKRRVGKEKEEDEEEEEEDGFWFQAKCATVLVHSCNTQRYLLHPPPPPFPSTRAMRWSSHNLSQIQWSSLCGPKRPSEIWQRLKTYLVPSLLPPPWRGDQRWCPYAGDAPAHLTDAPSSNLSSTWY